MYFWKTLSLFALCINAASIQRSENSVSISATQIRAKLGPQLSREANIIDANHGDFHAATQRWQDYNNPSFVSVVEVATVDDIVKTVKFANKNSIPVLAKNGGHSWIKGLGEIKGGIQITLAKLNNTVVNKKNVATVQAGARTYMVRDALWKLKKQTTTGVCECTGFLGPALGGGHGLTQGQYGLAIDNFIAARVMLGSGEIINVSATENRDLWWGLRGAGASFGIVTEIDVKVYDVARGADLWYYEIWDFSPKDILKIYEEHNNYLDRMSSKAVLFTMWYRNPSIDPISATIRVVATYNGPKSAADSLFQPFRAIKPLVTSSGTVPFDQVPAAQSADRNGPNCAEGGNKVGGGVYLTRYNPKSQKQAYELFNSTTNSIPEFGTSAVVFDGFSIDAVKKVPVESTAHPWRNQQILMNTFVTYQPNKTLDKRAELLSSTMRDILQHTSGHPEMRTYINYAFGNETLPQLYGSKERVARLQTLKRKYDPQNVFRFFGPPSGLRA